MGSIPIARSIYSPCRLVDLPQVKCLYQARDRIEAQLLCDFLDRQLVRASIHGDYLSGAAGELPADIYPSVWIVDDDDLSRARELLDRFLIEQRRTLGAPWRCPRCAEQIEDSFELCWNCGHARVV